MFAQKSKMASTYTSDRNHKIVIKLFELYFVICCVFKLFWKLFFHRYAQVYCHGYMLCQNKELLTRI